MHEKYKELNPRVVASARAQEKNLKSEIKGYCARVASQNKLNSSLADVFDRVNKKKKPEIMAVNGNIEHYTEAHDFSEYMERFEVFLLLNNITDEIVKTRWLCGHSGSVLYNKIKSVTAPTSPLELNYAEVKTKLEAILKPQSNEVLERAKFNSRVQNTGESASEYALALKHMAEHCNFGTLLDSLLRDRFIIGLRNTAARCKLLSSTKVSFNDIVAEAQAFEVAEQGKHVGEYSNSINKVHPRNKNTNKPQKSVQKKPPNSSQRNAKPCGRCLVPFHPNGPESCPALKWTCRHCKQKGHIRAKCRLLRNNPG